MLEVLARKTGTIRRELGSLAKVIDEEIEARLKGGIRLSEADAPAAELEGLEKMNLPADRERAITEEFEAVRERRRDRTAWRLPRGWQCASGRPTWLFSTRPPVCSPTARERTDEDIQGYVPRLARDKADPKGTATIRAFVDGRLTSVQAVFDSSDYSEITRAHDDLLR